MSDQVNHPSHYTQQPFECIEFTQYMNFPMGNAFKYIWRYPDKGQAIQDLEKAAWYLGFQVEHLTPCPTFGAPFGAMQAFEKFEQLQFPKQQKTWLKTICTYNESYRRQPFELITLRHEIYQLISELKQAQ